MQFIVSKMKQSSTLLKNASWLLSVEILAKLSRIACIVALAAVLQPTDYGTMMLAVACHEVLRLLLRSGTGMQIIQCAENELSQIAGNAVIIQWLFCGALTLLQILIAFPIGAFYDNPDVTYLLCSMALSYLFFPLVATKVFLLQRANLMKIFSLRNGACILAENIVVACSAYAGAGVYAIVYGKFAFAFAWVLLFWRVPVQVYKARYDKKVFHYLLKTSGILTSTELVRALRTQIDVFIAGRLLSPELFGLYSFAKSAGVGLSQSISSAYIQALYPHLCRSLRIGAGRFDLWTIYFFATLVGLMFVVQAALVPVYVPFLFDEKWQFSHNTIAILCLLALPVIWLDTYCAYLRALSDFKPELQVRIFCLLVSVLALLFVQPTRSETFASTLLLSSACWSLVLLRQIRVPTSLNYVVLLFSRKSSHE